MSFEIQKQAWAGLVKKLEGSQMSECGDFIVFEDNGFSIFFESVESYYQKWASEHGEDPTESFAEYLLAEVNKAHSQYEA